LNCIQERHGRGNGVSGWISSVDPPPQAPKIGIEHSMELVGRNFEVTAIRDALRAAGSGRGVTLLISGEVGIGKTRLAGAVADLAAGQ
jgi:transcriptional regulator with AAA-type ATPase domain